MGSRISSYFADGIGRIVAYVPQLVSATIILVLGYCAAVLLRVATRRALQAANFDKFIERRVHHRAISRGSPSVGTGAVVFWIVLLAAFTMASRALGLDALANGLNRILAYLPHVLLACVILAVGVGIGRLLGNLVADMAGRTVASLAQGAVIGLAIFMALDELQVAHGIVLTSFTLLLGAASVAAALAFGLGNRDLAAEYTRRWTREARAERAPTVENLPSELPEEPAIDEPTTPEPPPSRH